MSQNISDQPKGAVPQAVADDVAVLASEVRAIQRKAAAAWKTALGIWIILLLVIFSYLYFGVFRLLKKNLEPATVAQLVIGRVNAAVEAQGYGRLDSAEFPQKAAEQLKKMAPTVMQQTVKPMLQAQLKNLPELRKKLTAQIAEQAPALVDKGLAYIQSDLLPSLDERVMTALSEQADNVMSQLDEQLKSVIGDVVVTNKSNTAFLKDKEAIEKRVEEILDESMGKTLDELFAGLDQKVGGVREKMDGLVKRYNAGASTHRDLLEIRAIQLVEALFKGTLTEEAVSEGLVQDIQKFLGELSDIGLPEAAVQDIFHELPETTAPNLGNVPEEYRATIEQRIEALRKRGLPPQALKRIEESMRQAAIPVKTGAAAPPAGMPEEARRLRDEAMKRAAEAQGKARAGAGARAAGPPPAARGGPPPAALKAEEEAKKKAEEAHKAAEGK